ncbi:MAG TPA: helix-turn-helix domain-containing protein [Noviherbaspirillum sp.]|uniref:GlxA family transcriptional regulator n=1 Tax=Noviherbaspirillum sp. TaxID=1926288 RepID=UPI002D3A1129|nr:helix-turn-helix domain-containing protein [Noviherbaspirillum sp.]HYD94132.1 helix-turn-helix domain-containing protein [Noviherbaspirillum sp.]
MAPRPNIIRIGMLVYPGCLRSGAVMPFDVFHIANTLSGLRVAANRVHFDTCWLSARKEKTLTVGGLSFHPQPADLEALDALMLPGIDHQGPYDLSPLLLGLGPEQEMLRRYAQTGKPIISSCSSTCLVAEAGLLDGRRATTSWWLAAYFRKRFPAVTLDAEQLVVEDGNHVSSGGVTSYLDLALWLVGRFGGDALRQSTAKVLAMDANRSSQAPYIAAAMIQDEGHAVIERARRWLNQRLDRTWNMAELAAHCHTSPRTLLRRFQDAAGMSPTQYAQQLRVERAKALLESTKLSLEDITGRCGYEDVSTFSKVFKRWARITPREYRARFGLRQ